MTDALVLRELTDGVLLLTFNRPDRANAWVVDLEDAYFDALVDAAADPMVRAVVVTGVGRTFCPGMDAELLDAVSAGARVGRVRRPMTFAQWVPKPIIAAINGPCAGVGLVQACCADLRFAARGAKLTTAFTRRGLPAENGISWLLPRLVGQGRAMDLLLSARVVPAEEAATMGLVDRVCEPDELLPEALAYAADLARSCSPRSMAAVKQQVLDDWHRTLDESRQGALDLVSSMRQQPDFAEGVQSYLEKRAPEFDGLAVDIAVDLEAPRW